MKSTLFLAVLSLNCFTIVQAGKDRPKQLKISFAERIMRLKKETADLKKAEIEHSPTRAAYQEKAQELAKATFLSSK